MKAPELRHLLDEINRLESSLAVYLKAREEKFLYRILKRRVRFDPSAQAGHQALRHTLWQFLSKASFMSLLTCPVIYGFIVPALILDLSVLIYQAVIFPVYGIPKVKRSSYIALDRGHLPYLNWLERLNCDYCGYVNGLIAYTREVASRTEQYFCPVHHAIHLQGLHARHARFLPYGDAERFHARVEELQALIQQEKPE